MKKLCVWAVAALLMAACTPKAEKATDSGLLQSKFQTEDRMAIGDFTTSKLKKM